MPDTAVTLRLSPDVRAALDYLRATAAQGNQLASAALSISSLTDTDAPESILRDRLARLAAEAHNLTRGLALIFHAAAQAEDDAEIARLRIHHQASREIAVRDPAPPAAPDDAGLEELHAWRLSRRRPRRFAWLARLSGRLLAEAFLAMLTVGAGPPRRRRPRWLDGRLLARAVVFALLGASVGTGVFLIGWDIAQAVTR